MFIVKVAATILLVLFGFGVLQASIGRVYSESLKLSHHKDTLGWKLVIGNIIIGAGVLSLLFWLIVLMWA